MKQKGTCTARLIIIALFAIIMMVGPISTANSKEPIMLDDNQVENIVRRSYQYVALYNVNNKFAISQDGWNTILDVLFWPGCQEVLSENVFYEHI